jgi:molybdenum cofactor guanylyltransferase
MHAKDMTAVILAGGKSSRMGEDKLLMPLGGKPLIGHVIDTVKPLFGEVVVVTGEPRDYASFPVRAVGDLIQCPQKNSLTGIHAGLRQARTPYVLVMAGDMPFIRPGLLQYLCSQADGYDVVIPREGDYLQPLCAVYHQNCVPYIEALLSREAYKVMGFFPDVRVRYVDDCLLRPYDPSLMSFININTPDDYLRAQNMLEMEER